MDKTKKKYVILVVVTIVISIVALFGASYALLTMTLEGDKKITLTAGILKVDFTDGNYINLDNAAPVSDVKGQKMTPYTFTITNTGNINAYYHVSLEEEVTNTLTNNYLKMRLTNDKGYDSGIVKVSDLGSGNFEIKGEETLEPEDKVTYTLWMWLSEDADNNAQGKEYKSKIVVTSYDRMSPTVGNTLLENIPEENQYDDGVDTFITGEDPNNYIWYSGKLWRAVSVNNEAKTTKLVTQWNISTISYNASGNTAFEGSYMEDWLNDTSVDGFLGNLRDYENFIVTDAKWNATLDDKDLGSITRPSDSGTVVTDAVGLLNIYEYQTSYTGTTYRNGYLNNGLNWWTLTPDSTSHVRYVTDDGRAINFYTPAASSGARPSINLKSDVRIVDGNGTIDNPYRLNGDDDTNLSGTLLNTRYSGEYIRFGNDENNLYRIVSHETSGLTKITSAEPLKSDGEFITIAFDSNSSVNYSNSTTIGAFLNGEYLTNYVDSTYSDMIEESSIWYLGTVGNGTSYKLAKYTDTNMSSTVSTTTNAKVGLLRFGELMAGQFERYDVKGGSSSTGLTTDYWTLTPYSASNVRRVTYDGFADNNTPTVSRGARPSMNLKSNVQITSGTGTKSDPFVLSLGS